MNFLSLKANEFVEQLCYNTKVVVLDVRSERDYNNGHLIDALNIPLDSNKDISDFDKSKTYFVHCDQGNVSKIMATILSNNGFEKVIHLDDKFVNIFLYLGKKTAA